MYKSVMFMTSIVITLSGCTDNMYSKCLDAESLKVAQLTPSELQNIYGAQFSRMYNIEADNIFRKYVSLAPKEAQAHFDLDDKLRFTKEDKLIIDELEKANLHVLISEYNKVKKDWLADKVTYDEYEKIKEQCEDQTPCVTQLKRIVDLRNVINEANDKVDDILRDKFQRVRLHGSLYEEVTNQIREHSYNDIFAVLPSKVVKVLKNKLDEEDYHKKVSSLGVWKFLDYFFSFDVELTGYDPNEPWPYKKNRKLMLEYVLSGEETKNLMGSLKVFIDRPENYEIVMQICNERGLYE